MILQADIFVNGVILELLVIHSLFEWLNIIGLIECIYHSNCCLNTFAFIRIAYYGECDKALYLGYYIMHSSFITSHPDIFYKALCIILLSEKNMSFIHSFKN